MKNDNTKKTKKSRKRLAMTIIVIILAAIFLIGPLFYTVYFAVNKIKEKKNAEKQEASAVTETAEMPAYLL